MRRKRYFIYSLFLVILIPTFFMFLMNSGCGSAGGGAAYFETVEISASCNITKLNSDIAFWENSDNDPDNICDECTVYSDLVEFVIRSQSFENITMLPSDVRIKKVKIEYTPDGVSPHLASRVVALGQFVKPDSDYTLPIEVISCDQKQSFPLYRVREGEIHERETYTYSVKLTFSGIETATNKQGTFSTDLELEVLDRITQSSELDDLDEPEPSCDPFNVNVFPLQTTLNSDVAIWKDTDPTNDDICDSLETGDNDSVDIAIQTQQSFWNTGFVIEKVTISYSLIDSDGEDPEDLYLNSREITYNNLFLEPDDDFHLPIDIITKNQKEDPNQPLSSLKWNEANYSKIYEYSANIMLTFRRVATNELYYEFTHLSVFVSDFSDTTCDHFNVNVFPKQTTLNSDVAIWKDTDPTNDGICDSLVTGDNDSVDIAIETKQSFCNTGFVIEKVTIEYNPTDIDSPNLVSREIPYYIPLGPYDDFHLPIDIITKDQKENPPLSSLKWNEANYSKIYEYSANIMITFRRVATNELYYEFTHLSVFVSDFSDTTCDHFNVNVFPKQTTLNSDVAIGKDTDNDGICDSLETGNNDSVDIAIEIQQSGFVIEKVTISYSLIYPIEENPQDLNLNSREITYNNLSIEPIDNFHLPIDIITKDQKENPPLSSLKWNEANYSKIYEYLVKLKLTFRRVANDELYYEYTNLLVEVSDFSDNDCSWP